MYSIFSSLKNPLSVQERQRLYDEISKRGRHIVQLTDDSAVFDMRVLTKEEKEKLEKQVLSLLKKAYREDLRGAFERILISVVLHADLSSIMCLVASEGAASFLNILIRAGADVNKAFELQTPLNLAILHDKGNCVDILLEHPDLRINRGLFNGGETDPVISTPLYYALAKKNGGLAVRIIRKGHRLPEVMSGDEFAAFCAFVRGRGRDFDDLLKAHGFLECQEGLAGVLAQGSKHLEFMARDSYIMNFFNESEEAVKTDHAMLPISG